ncbi:MAG: type II toxin-antitoxin system RatA family toxin [Steroidobacteraceae bacterium]
MREVKRNALVSYTPAQMFALVEDFERYPEFLPWVSGARLLSREGDELVGRLEMERLGIKEHFTTRNRLQPPTQMAMQLVEGPFKMLDGCWRFTAICDAEGKPRGTRVDLDIRFEFKNAMLEMLMGKAFEVSCGSLVDAFTRRARALYGPASAQS